MSELQLFNGYTECVPVCVTLENVVGIIRNDSRLEYRTRQHRLALQQGSDSQLATSLKSASPCIAVAVRFDGGKRREHIVGWTGLSLVDIDHVEEGQIPALQEKIRTDAHTLLAYVTISGRGIRILYRWRLPDRAFFIVHRRGIPCGCPMMCVLRFIRVPTRDTPTVIIICHHLHGGIRGGFFLSFFSFYYARTYNSIFAGSSIWELRGFCKGSF